MRLLIGRKVLGSGAEPTVYGTIVGIWTGADGRPEAVIETAVDHLLIRFPIDGLRLAPPGFELTEPVIQREVPPAASNCLCVQFTGRPGLEDLLSTSGRR
jgi:hypothetical protein